MAFTLDIPEKEEIKKLFLPFERIEEDRNRTIEVPEEQNETYRKDQRKDR